MITNSNAFDELVKDRKVAVIGGCDNINWDAVNSADFVVRVNGHWQRQRGRVDALFYSCADDLDYSIFDDSDLWSDLKFAFVNLSHKLFGGYAAQKTGYVVERLLEREIPIEPYFSVPSRAWQVFTALSELRVWSRELAERYDFHPLTGVLATQRMILSPAQQVYVDGMSLYRRQDGSMPYEVGTHYIDPQIRFFSDVPLDRCLLNKDMAAVVNGYRPLS